MTEQEDIQQLNEIEGSLHNALTVVKSLISDKKKKMIFNK